MHSRYLKEKTDQSQAGKVAAQAKPVRRRMLIWTSATVLLVFAVAAAYVPAGGSILKPEAPFKVTPLTTYAGLQRHPSLSPDGHAVTFTWNGEKQDDSDVWAADR